MTIDLQSFDEVWCVDFEFKQPLAEVPVEVHCMVARELRTAKVIRLRDGEFPCEPPFRTDHRALFVAYLSSAELNCFRQLGWADPRYVLDLYVEHVWLKNGLPLPPEMRPRGLLVMMQMFGLEGLAVAEKEDMRQLAIRGQPFTPQEWRNLVDYCQTDVDALVELLPRVNHLIDWPRALLRGEYMKSVSAMETRGIPIDRELFELFSENWAQLKRRIIDNVADKFDIFEDGRFKTGKFVRFLDQHGLLADWPRTGTFLPKTDCSTLKDMARAHPWLCPLKEALATADVLKNNQLAIGSDGRNRAMLSPFGSRSGRNQPSNSKFIFGPATWLRGLIKPEPGRALAYIDWQQQELGIAAALSGDQAMMAAYQSGDPYLYLAQLAGAVPPGATKKSHPRERTLYKRLTLAVNYGMGPASLAKSIDGSIAKAEHLIQQHKEIFRDFWRWAQGAIKHCCQFGYLHTRFGWKVHLDHDPNHRSLANFGAQGNGAEMMRLGAIELRRRGIEVCCPIHDAFLVEASEVDIDDVVAEACDAMEHASRLVLDGFEIGTDAHVVRWPNRYMDEDRGRETWHQVTSMLGQGVHRG